jgi:hypothetical protein
LARTRSDLEYGPAARWRRANQSRFAVVKLLALIRPAAAAIAGNLA